ncbi:hypothetical protein [Pseudarthrobacter sp. N5]|uniref:hypothetical protein n=1 Tax=Pseudarthrobacter sp. N5 TaxID=3418416 RepID=UPI003CF3F5FE
MRTIVFENTIMIPRDRSEVYAYCVGPKYHYELPGQKRLAPEFVECVPNRSWTEKLETRRESIRYSYTVYPVADSTRLTVRAEFTPKGIGRLLPSTRASGYRKRETSRLDAIKKSLASRAERGPAERTQRK